MSEVPKADQVPLAPVEASMDSHQDIGKRKEVETLQGKDKGKDKKKDSSKPAEKASDTYLLAQASCVYAWDGGDPS